LALTSVASAELFNPITDTTKGTWTTHGTAVVADGSISTGFTNWQVDSASYTLNETMTFSPERALSFSFDATNAGTGNGMLTLALIGTTNAVVVGHGSYDRPATQVQVGVTNNVTAIGGYGFAATNASDDVEMEAMSTWDAAMPTGETTTLSGQIAWDGDSYALTLFSSAIGEGKTPFTQDLGLTSLDLTKVMVTIEGGGTVDGNGNPQTSAAWLTGSVSNIIIPEPATATLSLLALAGLAARRRRK